MRHRVIVFMTAAICAACAFGQSSNCGNTVRTSGMLPGSGVAGAPYSGDRVAEQVQTLADGTHITQKQPVQKVYRDSLGRMRWERPTRGSAGPDCRSATLVEISDPVAGVEYIYALDTVIGVVHRQQILPYIPPVKQAPTASAAVKAEQPARKEDRRTSEKLGTRTIEGVLAEGARYTRTIPVDSQDNDRPITIVNEYWTSVELNEVVLYKHNDPRSGEDTQRLTNISRSEPAASLFQPPPDYKVVDETGPFKVTWGDAKSSSPSK